MRTNIVTHVVYSAFILMSVTLMGKNKELGCNLCETCIRKEYEQPKIIQCCECGHYTMSAELHGASLLYKCCRCGYSVVGASFFPPCSLDRDRYTIKIFDVEHEKMTKVAHLFGVNVKSLLEQIRAGQGIETTLYQREAVALLKKLEELQVENEIAPDFEHKYPDFFSCKFLR